MPTEINLPSITPSTTIIIDAERKTLFPDLNEVWRYRDLLFQLSWRDISARYRQSVVGFGWAFVRPLVSVLIYTIIFSKIVKISTGDIPYPIFNLSGLIVWMYFVSCLQGTTSSIAGSGHLLTKVYLPRLILPLSSIASASVELLIQLSLLFIVLIFYGIYPSLSLLLFPFSILLIVLFAMGIGLWLTSINVKYRDVGLALPFFLQLGMYSVPLIYPTSAVPVDWLWLYRLNPLVNLIDFFRYTMLGNSDLNVAYFIYSCLFTLINLILGAMYFHKSERSFADTI